MHVPTKLTSSYCTDPEFFFPNASAQIAQFEGSGAYADFRGSGVDAAYATRLKTMNFGINWDAVFPYPFHGMWMPYAPYYGETWENCFLHPTYDKQPSPFNVSRRRDIAGIWAATSRGWPLRTGDARVDRLVLPVAARDGLPLLHLR